MDDIFINCTKKGIDDFIQEYKKNPFSFVYECDIQAKIYCNIYNELMKNNRLFSSKKWKVCNYLGTCRNQQISFFNYTLIHCEQTISGKASDIIILDDCDKNIENHYSQKIPHILVEIKLRCEKGNYNSEMKKDYNKLQEILDIYPNIYGISLCFIWGNPKNRNFNYPPVEKIELNNKINGYFITPQEIFLY
jgi:hypothetical protein